MKFNNKILTDYADKDWLKNKGNCWLILFICFCLMISNFAVWFLLPDLF